MCRLFKINYVVFLIVQFVADTVLTSITLEWSLGNYYPVSKLLDPGTEQDLYCSVDNANINTLKSGVDSVLLQCPLSTSVCASDCEILVDNPKKNLNCSNISDKSIYGNKIIFKYRIRITSNDFAGTWKCQYRSSISRSVKLEVTKKPYITDLTINPYPVWRNSRVNITCFVMPMYQSDQHRIVFERLLGNGVSTRIVNASVITIDSFTKSLILDNVQPGRDDKIQCTVFTMGNIIAKRVAELKIFYLPEQVKIQSSEPFQTTFKEQEHIRLNCSAIGGYPKPNLILLKQQHNASPIVLHSNYIRLTKKDNHASFFCKIENIDHSNQQLISDRIVVKVEYRPEKVKLIQEPPGLQEESKIIKFICGNDEGSEPPSRIQWILTDNLGRNLSVAMTNQILHKESSAPHTINRLKEVVVIKLSRQYNGYGVVCSIKYQQNIVDQRSSKIRVSFSPEVVEVNSNPLGPVLEMNSLTLTCKASSAHPAPLLTWYKTEPGNMEIDMTSNSYTDNIPSNFSGVQAVSHLKIHGVNRRDQGTIYRCQINHICLATPITKEYDLVVYYPPVVKVYASAPVVEQGDSVLLYCRTQGGQPHDPSRFRYSWGFCPPTTNSNGNSTNRNEARLISGHDKPSAEIKKHCGSLSASSFTSSTGILNSPLHNSTSINISHVSSQHRGYYSCRVSSIEFASQSSIGYYFLNVLYAPVVINISPGRLYADLNSDLMILVHIYSNPSDLTIKWFYRPHRKLRQRLPRKISSSHDKAQKYSDSQMSLYRTEIQFKAYGRFESMLMENFTLYLKIRSLKISDLGEYSCEISNRLGKQTATFEVYSSDAISIPQSSIEMKINQRKVSITFNPPSLGHFTHLILRMCRKELPTNGPITVIDSNSDFHNNAAEIASIGCKDMQVSNPLSGQTSVILPSRESGSALTIDDFIFRLMLYNHTQLLQTTKPIMMMSAKAAGHWVEMSAEMMISIIIAIAGIVILMCIAFFTLILLKCKRKHQKEILNKNHDIPTGPAHPQLNSSLARTNRSDYLYLNNTGTTNSLSKNGNCHCFTNYPMEMRSDNGSDHSMHSQNYIHPSLMMRKIRDNGEMESIHSGGSHQSPDLLLTERTSLTSSGANFSGVPQQHHHVFPAHPHHFYNGMVGQASLPPNSVYSSHSSAMPSPGPLLTGQKMTLLTRPRFLGDFNVTGEDYPTQNDVIFAAVDDPMGQQHRLIPISSRNLIANGHLPSNGLEFTPNFQLTQFLNPMNQQDILQPSSEDLPAPPRFVTDTSMIPSTPCSTFVYSTANNIVASSSPNTQAYTSIHNSSTSNSTSTPSTSTTNPIVTTTDTQANTIDSNNNCSSSST